jgi:putative CocE/NonD family hydrolase
VRVVGREHQPVLVENWLYASTNQHFSSGSSAGCVESHNWSRTYSDGLRCLEGAAPLERPPVRIFVMGANQWRDEDAWPLARAVETRLYLRAGGALSREVPADEAADGFAYDPRDPVPTVGGSTLLPGGGFFMGPRDRARLHARPDVLLYVSDVLAEDIAVTGPVTARLTRLRRRRHTRGLHKSAPCAHR